MGICNCGGVASHSKILISLRNSVAQVEGLTWYTGAISNAEWEGGALKDVLDYAPWIFSKNDEFGPWRRTWWKGAVFFSNIIFPCFFFPRRFLHVWSILEWSDCQNHPESSRIPGMSNQVGVPSDLGINSELEGEDEHLDCGWDWGSTYTF